MFGQLKIPIFHLFHHHFLIILPSFFGVSSLCHRVWNSLLFIRRTRGVPLRHHRDTHAIRWSWYSVSARWIPALKLGQALVETNSYNKIFCHGESMVNQWWINGESMVNQWWINGESMVKMVNQWRKMVNQWWKMVNHPLVNNHNKLWKITMLLMGKATISTGSFSIAMLTFTRG